jgi:two-component system, OmpR family, KDP operon response regulator KdpE
VKQTLLVVDDEPQFLRTLATNLRGAGYDVETAGTVASALSAAKGGRFDAVVLDLVLPDGSGTDVCAGLRAWSDVPIVVVSAVGEEREKVDALDAGADDYVVKPFALAELLARLRAVLRRVAPSTDPILRVGSLEIDREGHSVRRDGKLVHLTPHEFDLLRLLGENEGKLMTHARILREVWGPLYRRESNYLHVYVSQLRRKIEDDPARPQLLVTAPGIGYRLVAPQS